jgi:outer membrane protein insertion porin family
VEELEERARRVVAEEPGPTLHPAVLDDAARALLRLYRERGFPFAEVTARVLPGDPPVHELQVREGRRVTISEFRIEPEDPAAGRLRLPEHALERLLRTLRLEERPFDLVALEDAAAEVRVAWRAEGFLDAKTGLRYDLSPERDTVAVVVTVEEGPQVLIGEVVIEGAHDLGEGAVRDALPSLVGQPFSRGRVQDARAAVADLYGEQEFPFAEVEALSEVDRAASEARVVLRIREGERCAVGSIRFVGLVQTEEGFARRRFGVEEGEAFRASRVSRGEAALSGTGLFDDVRVERKRTRPGRVDLDVLVKERKPWETELFVGYGSYEKIRGGLRIGTANFAGTGRRLFGEVRASTKGARGEASLVNPYFLDLDLASRLAAFYEVREEPSFTVRRGGGSFSVKRGLFEKVEGEVGYVLMVSDAYDLGAGIPSSDGDRVLIGEIRSVLTREDRDSLVDPTRGTHAQLTYEAAAETFGSDIGFHRLTFGVSGFERASRFWDELDWLVLAGSARGGLIWPFGGVDDVPIQERFFLGGENTVRSFSEATLGPENDEGEPVGGEAFLNFSGELRFPLFWRFRGAVFGDAGTVQEQANEFGLSGMRYAVGVGLRLMTPVGPVRLDYGVNPDRREGERRAALFFSVGYSF